MSKKKTVPPKYPRELTAKQRSEIIGGIECEGFAYYFLEYTSPDSFEKHAGPLPRRFLTAWNAFIEAHDALREAIGDLDDEADE